MNSVSESTLWWLSRILSLAAILVIVFEWPGLIGQDATGIKITDSAEIEIKDEKLRKEVIVENNKMLRSYLNKWTGKDRLKADSAYRVPTGFFIQSLSFQSSNEVNFTGHIWQKISKDFPDYIDTGFDFPEQVNSSGTEIRELYCDEVNDTLLKGWYFDVTVRQVFDYSKYPFDSITAWLRLWPRDFNYDDEILLVPDFDAYDMTKPTFGLDADIVNTEWNIDKTFFSYHENEYNTNFGYTGYPVDDTYREFYINLGLKRNMIDAIILNLIPLFIVALLLFAQVMTVTGKKNLSDKFGFNTSGAIATCSALFFIVLLAHIQVRQQFLNSPLVYIEYFYLIMYLFILLTALNAYSFSIGEQKTFNFMFFRDNLIPKLAFWPLLLWMMALATIIVL
ncbi:MAG TPA: hypothetical protein VKN36_10990 [Eudoraea sp.]|nr:hypothetical protein [Eudoraea sp.]